MLAKDLEATMRRLGLLLIVALLLQVKVDGRQVLLPFAAAAGAVLVWRLRPLAGSTRTRRSLWSVLAAAGLVAAAGVVSWLPSQEPGRWSAAVALLTVLGLAHYARLVQEWAATWGWADAAENLRRAVFLLIVDAAIVVVGLGLLLALGEPATSTHAGPFLPSVVLGRSFEGPGVIAGLVVFTLVWVMAATNLQMGSKAVRAQLAASPDDQLTPA